MLLTRQSQLFGSRECRRVRARDQTGASKVSPVPCENELTETPWQSNFVQKKKTVQNTSQTENRVAYGENRTTNRYYYITTLCTYLTCSSLSIHRIIAGKSLATSFDCKYIETSSGMQHNVDELLVGILKQIRLKIQKTEQQMQLLLSSPNSTSTSSSSRSLFRKRSGRRRQQQQQQQQQQHRVNYQGGLAGEGEGSCCISTSTGGVATGGGGYRITSSSSTNRRSASLRVRRLLGKAVWTCAEYYHRNKSRSCEDLHVL